MGFLRSHCRRYRSFPTNVSWVMGSYTRRKSSPTKKRVRWHLYAILLGQAEAQREYRYGLFNRPQDHELMLVVSDLSQRPCRVGGDEIINDTYPRQTTRLVKSCSILPHLWSH